MKTRGREENGEFCFAISSLPLIFSVAMKIKILPDEKTIDVSEGQNLLEALIENGIPLDASCGGAGVCGQCRVRLMEGELSSELGSSQDQEDFDRGWRQACLSTITGDAVIRIPSESRLEAEVIYERKAAPSGQYLSDEEIKDLNEGWKFDPPLKKVLVELPPPSPEDNVSDMARLTRKLRQEFGVDRMRVGIEVLRVLPKALREGDWKVTATLAWTKASDAFMEEDERPTTQPVLIRIEPGDTRDKHYALAIDIGTTTISGQVIDLHNGEARCTLNEYNAQIQYGADVISRIVYALKPGGLRTLQGRVVESINKVIANLSEKCGVEAEELSHLTAAGNTTMTHLLLKLYPKWLRESPYVPVINSVGNVMARELGIDIGPWARLYSFPGVASYVGGDIVAGVLATGMYKKPEMSLLIDIGTNGEIVVGNSDFLLCASASAGPAFEGGGITCGMHAGTGAIERFRVDPLTYEVKYDTIRYSPARGVCGSGIINAIAALMEAGLIEPNGKINVSAGTPITRAGKNGPEIILAVGKDTEEGADLVMTEADIDNLMRAKAAMYAGYSALLEHVGLAMDELDTVYLAGNFGNTLDIENAITIGLLPDMDREKFKFVGNTSLRGAAMVTMSSDMLHDAEIIGKMMTNVEFWDNPAFMEHYMASMFFPHTDEGRFPSVMEKIAKIKERIG